jgi:hypothetical protein
VQLNTFKKLFYDAIKRAIAICPRTGNNHRDGDNAAAIQRQVNAQPIQLAGMHAQAWRVLLLLFSTTMHA